MVAKAPDIALLLPTAAAGDVRWAANVAGLNLTLAAQWGENMVSASDRMADQLTRPRKGGATPETTVAAAGTGKQSREGHQRCLL